MPIADQPRNLGVIETDAFCEGCGFNLHAQRVWRDERTGLPLCLCPECGRHHAAGVRTTAGMPWLGRLATLGLVIWLLIALAFVVASFGLMLGLQAGASELFLRRSFETTDGRAVYTTWTRSGPDRPRQRWALPPTNQVGAAPLPEQELVVPEEQVVYRVRPSPLLSPPPGVRLAAAFRPEVWPALAGIVAGAALSVVAVGVIAACAAWFWRPRRRIAWLLLPLLAALAMGAIEWSSVTGATGPRPGRESQVALEGAGLIVASIAINAALQLFFLTIGLRLGRPIVRRLLMIFIPPRARQAFAFLWHCDGLVMPYGFVPRSLR